jgi:hypothetical protein
VRAGGADEGPGRCVTVRTPQGPQVVWDVFQVQVHAGTLHLWREEAAGHGVVETIRFPPGTWLGYVEGAPPG